MKLKALALATTIFTSAAWADTTLVYNNAKGQEASVMYLSGGVIKMVSSENQEKTEVIYRQGEGSFTVVMHGEKKYMSFGPEEIKKLSDVSAMVDAMLEKQLANMPEAQRAQARAMMEGMIKSQLPKQAPVPEYQKTAESRDVNGYACDVVEKITKGKNAGDFCVAEYSELGITAAEYDAISGMMKVAEKLASQFGNDNSMNLDQIGQVVPVQYDMNGVKASLVEVSHKDLGANAFNVPADYERQNLPDMGM